MNLFHTENNMSKTGKGNNKTDVKNWTSTKQIVYVVWLKTKRKYSELFLDIELRNGIHELMFYNFEVNDLQKQ